MDDETRAELIEQVEAYRLVDETIKTTGWNKFLLPRFERLKEAYSSVLMNATDMPSVIRAQEGIKAVDMLIDDINLCISEGREAIEVLAKEKKK